MCLYPYTCACIRTGCALIRTGPVSGKIEGLNLLHCLHTHNQINVCLFLQTLRPASVTVYRFHLVKYVFINCMCDSVFIRLKICRYISGPRTHARTHVHPHTRTMKCKHTCNVVRCIATSMGFSTRALIYAFMRFLFIF